MSFYTSLTGLNAAQADMNSISHNLANVNTNGFKKSRTDFADVMSSSVTQNPKTMIGSGTVLKGNIQQFSQGNTIQSSSALSLAISGDGFFAVKPQTPGQSAIFTRNGAFSLDNNNFITDSSGNALQAYPVDGSGNVIAADLSEAVSLKVPATNGIATPTSTVGMSVNLSSAETVPTTGTFNRFDSTSYNQSTQTTIYDSNGTAQTLTSYFKRDSSASPSTWSVYNFVGDQQLTSGGNDHITLSFNSSGAITSPSGATAFDAFTPQGAQAQGVSLNFGSATTQTASPFKVASSSQDGKAVGQFQSVSVDADGMVKATFSNGDVKALGKVMMINFADPTGLRQLGNSNWAATGVSGLPVVGSAGVAGMGTLMSSTLER